MAVLKVVTTFESRTNVVEDQVQWTHFFVNGDAEGVVPSNAQMDSLGGAIANAYATPAADPQQPSVFYDALAFLAGSLSRTVVPKFKVYVRPNSNPQSDWGSPKYGGAWAGMLPSPTIGTDLPREVAVCQSFHGDLTGFNERIALPPSGPGGDILPRAARRGRLFFGPLNTAAGVMQSNRLDPAPKIRAALNAAGLALRDNAGLAAAGYDWAVYSRKSGAVAFVTGGWVDNEWDTQRRRGQKATIRDRWGTGA